MAKKRYTINTACPQCGCSHAQVLTEAEMRDRYGSVPNFEMECHECLQKFSSEMKSACPGYSSSANAVI